MLTISVASAYRALGCRVFGSSSSTDTNATFFVPFGAGFAVFVGRVVRAFVAAGFESLDNDDDVAFVDVSGRVIMPNKLCNVATVDEEAVPFKIASFTPSAILSGLAIATEFFRTCQWLSICLHNCAYRMGVVACWRGNQILPAGEIQPHIGLN